MPHTPHLHTSTPNRKLREVFNIDASDYMLSLCSDTALRLLNTPGKSGAVFFLSQVCAPQYFPFQDFELIFHGRLFL
jgi:hypothetical protein